MNMADGDEADENAGTAAAQDEYDAEDETRDPEYYPHVVAELNLDLKSEVLRVAVPLLSKAATSTPPAFESSHMIFVVACADAALKMMSVPLAPPVPGEHQEYLEDQVIEIGLQDSKSISKDIAVKIAPTDNDPDRECSILVASVGSALSVWKLPLSSKTFSDTSASLFPRFKASISCSKIAFGLSSQLENLLVADASGSVRILELRTRDEQLGTGYTAPALAKWTMSYQTPFHEPENYGAVLARRKKILSAAWVLGGRGIMVLLEDGQWGVWDASGNTMSAGKSIQDFAFQGYLATSSPSNATSQPSQKNNSGPKLAPMTPNTRKQKAQNLFAGPAKPSDTASFGGISIINTTSKAGQTDENVALWYNDAIYAISSMQTFWQRSTSTGGSSDKISIGGLYAPGLTHLSDFNLMNENITSISQFPAKSTTTVSALGLMNVQSDLLVSAEHRYVILQHNRPQIKSRHLLPSAIERPMSRDQRMLDAGEADLGGMNRILDGMAGDGRVRRVGFAS